MAARDTEVEDLKLQVLQLRAALGSRVLIEQATGIVAERYLLNIDKAFELVRTTARSERRGIRLVAGEVVASVETRKCPVARHRGRKTD